MNKDLIRDEISNLRAKLDKNKHKEKSDTIIKKLMSSKFYRNSNTIMTYISFKDEIDTHEFIKKALIDGKTILVPITISKGKQLKPSQIKDFNELEIGFYNILTPKKEFIRYVNPKDIDLIIVPGLGFDKEGFRVGFGGGYYDRFLSHLDKVIKVSIAFDFQILDRLPREDFDIPVDYIYTEKRIIETR